MSDFTPNVFNFDFEEVATGPPRGKKFYEYESGAESPSGSDDVSKGTATPSVIVKRRRRNKHSKPKETRKPLKSPKESSFLDLPSFVFPTPKAKKKGSLNFKNRSKSGPNSSFLFSKKTDIDINGPEVLGQGNSMPKPRGCDCTSSGASEETPNKSRQNINSPLSRVNKMKADHLNLKNSSKQSFSSALQKSLADMSEHIINSKRSSLTSEDERCLNEDADGKVSQQLITRTEKRKPKVLSKYFKFGGLSYDNFDCFQRTPVYFVNFFSDAFVALELSPLYNNDTQLLSQFINTARANYRSEKEVPFHNFNHGFSVGQVAVTFILRSYFMKKFFEKKTLFTFVITAILHDVDHPGNDNFYELISNSTRHAKHGKDATLENHHSEKMIELMKAGDGSSSIIKYLNPYNQNVVIENACDLILATDMSKHGKKLAILQNIKHLKDLRGEENHDKQLELLQCIIHACDLSGQCFSNPISVKWEENIHKEMTKQYKRLIKDKLPIPENMKRFGFRGRNARKARYKSQAMFIEKVLIPFWTEVVRLFPEMSDFLVNLRANFHYFDKKSKSNRR